MGARRDGALIRRVYPDQYATSRPRRRCADAVIAAAGVDKRDVCSIKRANGKWYVNSPVKSW